MHELTSSIAKLIAPIYSECAASASLWGQGASSLRGVVTDPQKGVLTGGQSHADGVRQESGATRAMLTTNTGGYQFLQLRLGAYSDQQ